MLDQVQTTLSWIKDVEEGEFIEQPPLWNVTHLSFEGAISVISLDYICALVNSILIMDKAALRVCWVAGEIRPVGDARRIAIIDRDIFTDLSQSFIRSIDVL